MAFAHTWFPLVVLCLPISSLALCLCLSPCLLFISFYFSLFPFHSLLCLLLCLCLLMSSSLPSTPLPSFPSSHRSLRSLSLSLSLPDPSPSWRGSRGQVGPGWVRCPYPSPSRNLKGGSLRSAWRGCQRFHLPLDMKLKLHIKKDNASLSCYNDFSIFHFLSGWELQEVGAAVEPVSCQ